MPPRGSSTEFSTAFPALRLDSESILFGAATHDIGKVLHPEELRQPGREHESAGASLLAQYGVPVQICAVCANPRYLAN